MPPDRTTRALALGLALLLGGAHPGGAGSGDEPGAEHAAWVRAHYSKLEYPVPMRDGVELFTAVYRPRDASDRRRWRRFDAWPPAGRKDQTLFLREEGDLSLAPPRRRKRAGTST